jgi:hypothetical protein
MPVISSALAKALNLPATITKVHVDVPEDGHEHQAHITKLLTSMGIETREQVVYNIDNLKMKYVTKPPVGHGAEVETAHYGTILGGHRYVKTKPDETKVDNLLLLPRF